MIGSIAPLQEICYNCNFVVLRAHIWLYDVIQGRVLREFSPEEVTANIYTMVDVLLHHFNVELQCGRSLQVCPSTWNLFSNSRALLFVATGIR